MREEQRRALAIPNTSMAVTIDIRGEGIHPPDKLCVGRRLAALALEQGAHPGRKAGGPVYRTHRARGGEVWVEFDRVEGGLMVGDRPMGGPVQPTPDVAPRWFEIAGEDRVWHPAAARIEDRQVVLSSPAVQLPVAVRYACHTRPQGGNLYNRAGWPASPFCSHLEWLGWEDPR